MGRSTLPEAWPRDPRASLGCKALAAALATHAEAPFGEQDVWPGPALLASYLNMTARSVSTFAAEGEALGWWTRIREVDPNHGGSSTVYRLHFPEFSPTRNGTEAERKRNGSGEETERKRNGEPQPLPLPNDSPRSEGVKEERSEGVNLPAPAPRAVSNGVKKATAENQSGLFGGETKREAPAQMKPSHLADAILTAYQTILPMLPQPRDPPTEGIMHALLAAAKREPDLDLWRERFRKVAASRHHVGQNDRGWTADLTWCLGPNNCAKIDAWSERPKPPVRSNDGKPQRHTVTAAANEAARHTADLAPITDEERARWADIEA